MVQKEEYYLGNDKRLDRLPTYSETIGTQFHFDTSKTENRKVWLKVGEALWREVNPEKEVKKHFKDSFEEHILRLINATHIEDKNDLFKRKKREVCINEAITVNFELVNPLAVNKIYEFLLPSSSILFFRSHSK